MLFSGATFTRKPDAGLDFSRVIRDNVSPDTRVVDIAMLGAHDAFSEKITPRSEVCPFDTNAFLNSPATTLAPGLLSRLMLAQKSDAAGQLLRGVRYFDVRLTWHNNTWYTQHGLISAPLRDSLVQIIDFLNENPGELIVFDMQHVRHGDNTFDGLWRYMADVTSGGKSLLDFVTYDPFETPLANLTLGQAARHGAGVVILAKSPMFMNCRHYEYDSSMRSTWHNKIRTREIIDGIQSEYEVLTRNPSLDRDKFRVNQAQTTPNFSGLGNSVTSVFSWSLLSRAAGHNVKLLEHENFTDWLAVMPIFMVDFSDSRSGQFNERVIELINAFNRR
jgi:hypothetical protein